MSISHIEWTDALGHETTGAIATHVVATDEASRPTRLVEQTELLAAPAFAANVGVGLAGPAQVVPRSMLARMLPTRQDLKVLPPVVELVAVDVVDHLASTQQPTQHLGCNEPVFVDVPPTVCHWVAWSLDQHVTVRRDRSTALPLGVHGPGLAARRSGHAHSVAIGR